MNPSSQPSAVGAPSSVPASPRTSRLERFLNFLIRHAGSVAVDHTHLLPLDRVSGRTGVVTPTPSRRACY